MWRHFPNLKDKAVRIEIRPDPPWHCWSSIQPLFRVQHVTLLSTASEVRELAPLLPTTIGMFRYTPSTRIVPNGRALVVRLDRQSSPIMESKAG